MAGLQKLFAAFHSFCVSAAVFSEGPRVAPKVTVDLVASRSRGGTEHRYQKYCDVRR